jgi:hypothetical protein
MSPAFPASAGRTTAAPPTIRAHLRPADGPHRPAHRGAGGDRRRSDPAAAGGRLGREVAARVAARARRPAGALRRAGLPHVRTNAEAPARCWKRSRSRTRRARATAETMRLSARGYHAADAMRLSARGYHRVLRVRARSPISTAPTRSAGVHLGRGACPTARWPKPPRSESHALTLYQPCSHRAGATLFGLKHFARSATHRRVNHTARAKRSPMLTAQTITV